MIEKRIYAYSESGLENLVDVVCYEYSNVWSDQVTKVNQTDISYDGMGNIISYRDNLEFQWDGKKLSSAKNIQSNAVYAYNDEGIRTSKTVNGVQTRYLIEGKDIIFEESKEHEIFYIYDSDMDIVGMILDGTTYYYEKNIQKDVIRILSENGEVLCSYAYDAWGNIISISGNEELAQINPIRYRSYYYDAETGLYYVESRYYDSEVGRFINTDSVEDVISDYTNLNLYAYCGNDPVNYYDPTGCAPIYLKTFVATDIINGEYFQYTELIKVTGTVWIEQMNKGGSNVNYNIASKQEFYDAWNSLINATAVVIMSHGSPTTLFFGTEYVNTQNITDNLKNKSIKFVWLISCNAGHYSFRAANIAYAISKKTCGGVVVAADATVTMAGATVYGSRYGFVAGGKIDEYWKVAAGPRTTANGWMIYKYTASGNKLSVSPTIWGMNEISIFNVSSYLVSRGFVSYK